MRLRLLTRSSRCICGAEFCYACGTKWKTGGCGCLTLNEQDLEDQVEQTEDAEREEMLQFAVENVERVHPDGRIDWRV